VPTETPLFFEHEGRPLYAVYHAPGRAREGAPVIVHCHGLGVEQITAYRAEVLSARAAAAAGFPVFRFHAHGHGDSAGDFCAVTLEALAGDAIAAAAEAKRRSGARRVVWLGVRFGGLVAAIAAARGAAESAGLVLWEPVHRPLDYFRGLLRGMLFSQVAEGRKPGESVDQLLEHVEREGRVDVHGYFLHRAIVESSRGEELEKRLGEFARPTLLVQVQARPRLAAGHAALAASLQSRGARVDTMCVKEEPGWHFISNPAWECAPLAGRVTEWLDALA
jgi:pimeloyl-ACP methyl ester carboxylesterase